MAWYTRIGTSAKANTNEAVLKQGYMGPDN